MLTRKAADEKREHDVTFTFRLAARPPQSETAQSKTASIGTASILRGYVSPPAKFVNFAMTASRAMRRANYHGVPNITPDPETGIGSWSEPEIKHALVEGMRPDQGRLAGGAEASRSGRYHRPSAHGSAAAMK